MPGMRAHAFALPAFATLWLGAFPHASGGEPVRLAVSLLQADGAAIQLRLRTSSDTKPEIGVAASSTAASNRLALTWAGTVVLDRPLPTLPPGEYAPLQALALDTDARQSTLALQLGLPMRAQLRRVGDSWVLRLEPENVPAAPRAGNGPAAPELLLLDVSINGRPLANVVLVQRMPDGALLLPSGAWLEARLAPPSQVLAMSDGTPAHAITALPGASYTIDTKALSLAISVPAAAFAQSRLDSSAPPPLALERRQPGAALNYDLSLDGGSGVPVTGSALLEARAFGRFGNLVSSGLVHGGGNRHGAERLDTFWRYDLPGRLESVVIGDTVGTGGGWSRPVRFGGLRWGRDFSMRPGFVTVPQLTMSGEAALPSTVDVLVNNARRISQPVPPGPFELSGVPVVTGAGEISMVVRDLLGHEILVRQSYYSSPRLLARGLTDFSLETGRLRYGYGQDSRYGGSFAAATWRAGLTQELTGEVRAEAEADRRAFGIEVAGLLGAWGVARVALAGSSDTLLGADERGHLVQLGIERSSSGGGGALQYEHASAGFAPFGEPATAAAVAGRARSRLLASVGAPLWGWLSGGVSYVRQTRWDGDRVELASLSLSMPVGRGASMNVAFNKRLDDDRAWRGAINLSLPLADGLHASSRIDGGTEGQAAAMLRVSRAPPAGPGLGWSVDASTQESQRARGALQYNSSYGEWMADVAAGASGNIAARLGARGSLGLLAGLPFASRPIGLGSFAVVEVEGMAGVPVKRSNQVVAETNGRGLAFVPGLLPWQANQLEIDPVSLPLDASIANVVQMVTPYAGNGSFVKFAVRRSRQALLVVQQSDGRPVPVGATARLLPDGPEFMAGLRGEIWLTDLAAGIQQVEIRWPGGGCRLDLPVPSGELTPERIGPLACGKEPR